MRGLRYDGAESGAGPIFGQEIEYGILGAGGDAVAASAAAVSAVIDAERAAGRPPVPWDHRGEEPYRDLRDDLGATLGRHASPLTAAHDVALANGGRMYVDHAHPEYSSPEVDDPRDLVTWDRAGEELLRAGMRLGHGLSMYKNTCDGKGASYGTHESYLVARRVPLARVIRQLTAFLVTRPLICGAGRVGLGQRCERAGYQISQRADYLERWVGLETTRHRPLINTRDEPHADRERFRRLHLIAGDANLLDSSTMLRVGSTALVLQAMVDDDAAADAPQLIDPIGACRTVSRDLERDVPLALVAGEAARAVDVQRWYLNQVRSSERARAVPWAAVVSDLWAEVLDALDPHGGPIDAAAQHVEWLAKLNLLMALRARSGHDWSAPALAAADVQWADIDGGIARRLEAAGACARWSDDAAIGRAMGRPPTSTRAAVRGALIGRGEAACASWAWVTDTSGRELMVADPRTAHVGAGEVGTP